MSLSQRLDVRQSQTLVMTPQLLQAIKLLQMSTLELDAFVEQEIDNNPLLERASGEAETTADDAPLQPGAPAGDPEPLSGTEVSFEVEESASDGYTESDRFAGIGGGGSFTEDDEAAAQNVAAPPSLRDHLLAQIAIDFPLPSERLIAASLVDFLDDAGYLPKELNAIRAQLGATVEQFDRVIARLQRLDPCGIFARSLEECLGLQLRERDRLDPAMILLLKNLDLVAKRDHAGLMRICRVDAEDLADMIAEIKRLDPKPAARFMPDTAQTLVPDVMLRPMAEGGWHVELNTDTLPRVLANERYYMKIQAASSSKADKSYIADRWQQATWLVKALHQRATTILKVAGEIVRQQDAFFTQGVQGLKPLVLKDISELVALHESTVSRVTQQKYIATPRGIFELKYFFTSGLARSDGGADMSSKAVCARIRALIEGEKPSAVLSDDFLSMILRGEGIDVARRTVAKYRESMKIPTSAQRKRNKRGLGA